MMITVKGTVMHGLQEASKIGFSTLNIYGPVDIISRGVFYGVTTVCGIEYNSVIYVGKNRNYSNKIYQVVESHLIGVTNVDYYGVECTIQIIKKIREDKEFTNIEDLIKQINEDIYMCTNIE